MDYQCCMIKPVKLQVARYTADTVHKLYIPTTVTKLRALLEISNIFRWLVSNFTRMTSSLSKRLRKSQGKKLGSPTEEKLNALETLKEKRISLPVFTVPKTNG